MDQRHVLSPAYEKRKRFANTIMPGMGLDIKKPAMRSIAGSWVLKSVVDLKD